MESSFVGVRPVESPETPASLGVAQPAAGQPPVSPSRSSLLETTTASSYRSAAGDPETGSEDGASTPGVVGAYRSPSGNLFLELASPRDDDAESAAAAVLPHDHRHRQRRHRKEPAERQESPSPTHQHQQQQHQHQSRHRHRTDLEHHRQAAPQQQQHQRGELLLA